MTPSPNESKQEQQQQQIRKRKRDKMHYLNSDRANTSSNGLMRRCLLFGSLLLLSTYIDITNATNHNEGQQQHPTNNDHTTSTLAIAESTSITSTEELEMVQPFYTLLQDENTFNYYVKVNSDDTTIPCKISSHNPNKNLQCIDDNYHLQFKVDTSNQLQDPIYLDEYGNALKANEVNNISNNSNINEHHHHTNNNNKTSSNQTIDNGDNKDNNPSNENSNNYSEYKMISMIIIGSLIGVFIIIAFIHILLSLYHTCLSSLGHDDESDYDDNDTNDGDNDYEFNTKQEEENNYIAKKNKSRKYRANISCNDSGTIIKENDDEYYNSTDDENNNDIEKGGSEKRKRNMNNQRNKKFSILPCTHSLIKNKKYDEYIKDDSEDCSARSDVSIHFEKEKDKNMTFDDSSTNNGDNEIRIYEVKQPWGTTTVPIKCLDKTLD